MKLLIITLENFQDLELVGFLVTVKRAKIFNEISYFNLEKASVTGQFNIVKLTTNTTLNYQEYDAVYIPGGRAAQQLRKDKKTLEVIKYFLDNNKWVFAICDVPNALYETGLLKGYKFVGYPIENQQRPQGFFQNKSVVVSKNLISAKSAEYAVKLGLKVIEKLANKELSISVWQAHSGILK
ncbi:putative intracellular protease/amidase [Mesomycoplasma hyorhinis HUB-1]|nr:putative intracellular protease/amidase [Mesomycoplasma hyorhinis HUB-1]